MGEITHFNDQSQGKSAQNQTRSSLTPEQRAFAEVVGREIARDWKKRVELREQCIHSRA